MRSSLATMTTNKTSSDNIAMYLRKMAEGKGEQTGIIEAANGKEITFAELEKRSDQYAHYLHKQGVEPL